MEENEFSHGLSIEELGKNEQGSIGALNAFEERGLNLGYALGVENPINFRIVEN